MLRSTYFPRREFFGTEETIHIMRRFALALCLIAASFGSKNGSLVDINHASIAELKALAGIQDAYARAIVKNRPYKNKAQLVSKQIIPETAYARIKGKIVAKQ